MGVRARGVTEIKTLSAVRGSGVHSNERHVHQFQIASLELERSRRTRERLACMSRVEHIESRLIEIHELIQKHQDALSVTDENRCAGAVPERRATANQKRRTLRY